MFDWLVPLLQKLETFFQSSPQVLPLLYLLGGKSLLFAVFVFLYILAKKFTKVPPQPVFDASWHMGSVAEIFFIFVAFQAVAAYLKNPFLASENIEGIIAVWALIEYLFLLTLIWFIVRFILRENMGHVGWHWGDLKGDGAQALRGIVFIVIVAMLTNFLYWTEILTPSTKIVRRVALADLFSGGVFSVVQLVLVLGVSPLCEETFYRGFVYPVLRNKIPKIAAIILVSLFFAAVHLQWNYFILLFLMSAAATAAYDKTQRLIAPVAIHIFYNLLILLGTFSY